MSGFNNPIVAGGILVRDYISSEGFVPGVSGWIIRRDGTAEFNDIVVRGNVIVGNPAVMTVEIIPNPISQAGEINFNPNSPNWLPGGLNSDMENAGLPNERGQVTLGSQEQAANFLGDSYIQLATESLDLTIPAYIDLAVADVAAGSRSICIHLEHGLARVGDLDCEVQWSQRGSPGGYYFEEFRIGAIVTTTGAPFNVATALIPLTVSISKKDPQYGPAGSQMNLATAVWTCPEDGVYNVDMQTSTVGGVAGTRIGAYVFRNGGSATNPDFANDVMDGSGRGRLHVSGSEFYTAGQTLTFQYLQSSGANQTMNVGLGSRIAIHRQIG